MRVFVQKKDDICILINLIKSILIIYSSRLKTKIEFFECIFFKSSQLFCTKYQASDFHFHELLD